MNRAEIEQAVLTEIHDLPLDKVETMLPTEGERALATLQKTGYLGSMPDVADLSEHYKDYLDLGDKV